MRSQIAQPIAMIAMQTAKKPIAPTPLRPTDDTARVVRFHKPFLVNSGEKSLPANFLP